MRKIILKLIIVFTLIISFAQAIPVKANENVVEPYGTGITVQKVNYTKSATYNGIKITVTITCNKMTDTLGTTITYIEESAVVSSSNNSTVFTGEFYNGYAGSTSSDDLTVIIYFTYKTSSGSSKEGTMTFTIRGEKLV